jgi:hypothetical protein
VRHAGNGKFRRHVGQHHREAGLADNRRDVDDAAGLLIDHTLDEGARGQEQAARIDVHDTVVFLVGRVLHRPRLRPDARIVDEDVDATERIQGHFAQTLRRLAIANVMFDGDGPTSQSLCAFFRGGAVDVGHHNRSAGGTQPLGDSQPYAARSTRDDGNAPVEISHIFLPLTAANTLRRG